VSLNGRLARLEQRAREVQAIDAPIDWAAIWTVVVEYEIARQMPHMGINFHSPEEIRTFCESGGWHDVMAIAHSATYLDNPKVIVTQNWRGLPMTTVRALGAWWQRGGYEWPLEEWPEELLEWAEARKETEDNG
jgi:hypothetical protein